MYNDYNKYSEILYSNGSSNDNLENSICVSGCAQTTRLPITESSFYQEYINAKNITDYHKIGNSIAKKEGLLFNEKEEINMSIVYTQILEDGIIMVADSRSTKTKNGEVEYDDDYQKIYYSEKFGMIISSTGLNEFRGETFSDVIKNCENLNTNKNKFLNDISNIMQTNAKYTNVGMNIYCGSYFPPSDYTNAPLFPEIFVLNIDANGEISNSASLNVGAFYVSGIEWAQKFLLQNKSNTQADEKYAKNKALFVKKEIKNLIAFSNENANKELDVIGGEVKAVILRPNGTSGTAEWV